MESEFTSLKRACSGESETEITRMTSKRLRLESSASIDGTDGHDEKSDP